MKPTSVGRSTANNIRRPDRQMEIPRDRKVVPKPVLPKREIGDKSRDPDTGQPVDPISEVMRDAVGSAQVPSTLSLITQLDQIGDKLEANPDLLMEELRRPLLAVLQDERLRLDYMVHVLQGQTL